MKIYTANRSHGYELCHPVNPDDFETITTQINGAPCLNGWKPLKMKLVKRDEGRDLSRIRRSFGMVQMSPFLRRGPFASLFLLLREYGELLKLICEESEVSIYNPTRVVDALDETISDIRRFDNGRIMMIYRYVFRADVIQNVHIFKIPNLRASPTFFSQHFVDIWKSAGLVGLDFDKVF